MIKGNPQVIHGRLFARATVAVVILSAWVDPLSSQRLTFDPSAALTYNYTSNITFVEEDGRSDYFWRLRLLFPVVRTTRNGSVSFAYSPQITSFQDVSELDFVGHRASFGVVQRLSPRSSLGFNAQYSLTQDQGDPESILDPDLFVFPRVDQEKGQVSLDYSYDPTVRWGWGFNILAADWNFKPIDDFEQDPEPELVLEDKQEYRFTVRTSRRISPRSTVGISYRYQMFRNKESLDENVHGVSFNTNYSIKERLTTDFRLGVFRREFEDPPDATLEPREATNGISGTLGLTRNYRRIGLRFFVTHTPSGGGTFRGTSDNTVAQFLIRVLENRKWSFNSSLRWARRDPTELEQPTVDSYSIRFNMGRTIFRVNRLTLSLSYVSQTAGGDRTDIAGANIGGVWFPLGRTRLGGGGP